MQRILAVDDDKDILEVLKYILEESGYQVHTLSDGNKLIEQIKEFSPDLILLDIMLGNLDGRELCRDVKRKQETHNIPVIMISASHTARTINNNNDDGPDDFLAKPFDITDLLTSIERQLAA